MSQSMSDTKPLPDLPLSPPSAPNLDWMSDTARPYIEDIVAAAEDALSEIAFMQYRRGQEGWETHETEKLRSILEDLA